MPNAKDAVRSVNEKFLILGNTGGGKTTLFTTIPGRKFIYLFDPNALNSLQGCDIEYEEFLPDIMPMNITSLAKGKGDRARNIVSAETYLKWEEDFETKIKDGYFNDFDVIGFDSCTTMLSMIMDRVLQINGRAGQWPQQDDYGPQMNAFTKIVRNATSLGKTVYFTGHVQPMKDDVTGRISNTPLLTGQLKSRIPLLFSEIYFAEALGDQKGNTTYTIQTKSDRMNPLIRCTLRGLDARHDVTIDFNKPRESQGLGAILKK